MTRSRAASAGPVGSAAGISTPDWAERLVRVLDDGLQIPGTQIRFGADAVLGLLLPGVGDVLTGSGSLALLWLALRRGVPTVVLLRMVLNVLADAGLGLLPVAGDAFDLFFKSNRRNLHLLQRASYSPKPSRALDYMIVGGAGLLLAGLVSLPWMVFYWLVTWSEGS